MRRKNLMRAIKSVDMREKKLASRSALMRVYLPEDAKAQIRSRAWRFTALRTPLTYILHSEAEDCARKKSKCARDKNANTASPCPF